MTNEQTDLTGFGVDVPFSEKLLHNFHVIWTFHSRKSSQHNGRVASFVLVIHVTHIWMNHKTAI